MKYLLLLLLSLLGVVGCSRIEPTPTTNNLQSWDSVKNCVDTVISKIEPKAITTVLIYESSQVCLMQMQGEGDINDFRIRRAKFAQQTYDERVLLWMVVVITLSGVILAGLQMVASYRIASAGKGNFDQPGELIVEQGRLSLKSSVTGLFILICSFAFFWVFVYEVFVLKEINMDGNKSPTPTFGSTPKQLSSGPLIKSEPAVGPIVHSKGK